MATLALIYYVIRLIENSSQTTKPYDLFKIKHFKDKQTKEKIANT